jgi:hypothetical protein
LISENIRNILADRVFVHRMLDRCWNIRPGHVRSPALRTNANIWCDAARCACQSCGKPGRTEGQHHGYSQPLNVRWLCCACHAAEHRHPGAVASTHRRALEIVSQEILKAHPVDVPTDAAALDE